MSGGEAKSIGFVSRVYESTSVLLEEATALAERIAQRSPIAVRGAKELMRFTQKYGVEASLRYTAAWQSGAFPGVDIEECIAAKGEGCYPSHLSMPNDRNIFGVKDDGVTDIN